VHPHPAHLIHPLGPTQWRTPDASAAASTIGIGIGEQKLELRDRLGIANLAQKVCDVSANTGISVCEHLHKRRHHAADRIGRIFQRFLSHNHGAQAL
jgi:hypothetical protein